MLLPNRDDTSFVCLRFLLQLQISLFDDFFIKWFSPINASISVVNLLLSDPITYFWASTSSLTMLVNCCPDVQVYAHKLLLEQDYDMVCLPHPTQLAHHTICFSWLSQSTFQFGIHAKCNFFFFFQFFCCISHRSLLHSCFLQQLD